MIGNTRKQPVIVDHSTAPCLRFLAVVAAVVVAVAVVEAFHVC
jgi:hypothetical protein